MRKILPKILAVVTGTLIMAALLGQTYASTLAQTPELRPIFGTVVSVQDNVITVQTEEETLSLTVNSDTALKVPGMREPALENITSGSRIAVVAQEQDGTLVALNILVKPAKPSNFTHIVGVVVESSPGQAVILDHRGKRLTLDLPVGREVQPGQMLTVIVGRGSQRGDLEALAIEGVETVLERLIEALDRFSQVPGRGPDVERLRSLLEENGTRLLTTLNRALAKSQAQSRIEIQQALSNHTKGLKRDFEARGPRAPSIKVEGNITSIDPTTSAVTITPEIGEPITLTVTGNTKIEVEDKDDATLADLEVDDPMEAKYNPDTLEALKIEVEEPKLSSHVRVLLEELEEGEVEGRAAAIDLDARTVTITPEEGDPVTLTVTDDTEIEVDDEEVAPASLTLGLTVKAEFDAETLEAEEIETREEVPLGDHLMGVIQAIDTGLGTITVAPNLGESVTLTLPPGLSIEKNGDKEASLTDLQVGDLVGRASKFNPNTQEVLRLVARAPTAVQIRGTVSGVDTDEGTVTVTTEGELDLVTLTVTSVTGLEKNGDPGAGLADLAIGDRIVAGFYNPVTLEAIRLVVKSAEVVRVSGTVEAVDVQAGTVSIRPRRG